MKPAPGIFNIYSVGLICIAAANGYPRPTVNRGWLPERLRPSGRVGLGRRLYAAWLVFTGRADALTWD